ncbi:MAG: stage II sporulation protein M [Geminicoccaceae bacterium]
MAGQTPPIGISQRLRKEREPKWRKLEDLVGRAERHGLDILTADELRALPMLYRHALSSLALARGYAMDLQLIAYLNALGTRAFILIHGPRQRAAGAILGFFIHELPRAVRAAWLPMFISALALGLGIALGWSIYEIDPALYYSLHGEDEARHPASSTNWLRETIYGEEAHLADLLLSFALFLFQHNTAVCLTAFGLGFAFGIPTLIILVLNGVYIGSMIALFWSRELGPDFVAWLSIHGTTELTAVTLASAGGLLIAQHMLYPAAGQSRLTALRRHGWQAATLLIGAVVLLFIAAGIEGFLRQLVQQPLLRAEIGAGMALLWIIYFSFGGRTKAQPEAHVGKA